MYKNRPAHAPGLVTAGLSAGAFVLLLGGCGRSDAPPPSQVAARVNKAEISVHQINSLLQRQAPVKPEQSEAANRAALERLIDQALAVEKAKSLKLDRTPQVMQAIDAARSEIVARAYAEHLASNTSRPTQEEIKAYYESKPLLFKERRVYQLQQLQVQAPPEQLATLRDKVQNAKSMSEVSDYLKSANLPVRVSQDTTASEAMPPALVEQFAGMKPGQALFSNTPGGARILIIASATKVPATLEQASQAIEQSLLNERRVRAVMDGMKALRETSQIEYLGNFAAPAASSPGQGASGASSPSVATTGEAASTPGDSRPAKDVMTKGLGLK